jgi:outer membrane protein assembly factor BamB
MTTIAKIRIARPLAVAIALALVVPAVSGCADTGAILRSADVFNVFQRPERRLPGDRRPALESPDRLAVDPQAASSPVSLPGPSANSEWAQPGGPASNAPGHLAYAGGGGTAWTASVARVDRRERLTSSPIVYQGQVIVMDTAGSLAAYSLSGGGRAWSANLRPEGERGGGYGGGIAADGGVLVAATPFRKVYGVDPRSGGILWTADMNAPARSAPTVANGRAFVVSADNVLHGFDISDGSSLWTFTGSGSQAGILGNASPAVVGNSVIVPYSTGELIAFNVETGEPQWFDALTGASRFTTVSGLNDVIARPVVYEGVVYAISVSGRMIAVNARTGERLWAQNVASAHTPAVAGNSIFVTTLNGDVVALDRANGKLRWRQSLSGEGQGADLAGPLLAGGRLWVGTSDGRMITLNPSDGSVASSHSIGNPVYIGPIAANGQVLVLDNGGRLTAIN